MNSGALRAGVNRELLSSSKMPRFPRASILEPSADNGVESRVFCPLLHPDLKVQEFRSDPTVESSGIQGRPQGL